MGHDLPAPDALRRAVLERFGLALEGISDAQLRQALAEAPGDLLAVFERLPISESALFRNAPLWEWLDAHLLPGLIDRAVVTGRTLRILSLGCSQGQEVFSAAAIIAELLRRRGLSVEGLRRVVAIEGWDASAARIEHARRGRITTWSVRGGRPEWLAWFTRTNDGLSVPPALLSACRFEQRNLADLPASADHAFEGADVVLVQHVLLYFERTRAEALLARIARAMREGTVLILSPVEAHLLPSGFSAIPGAPVGVGQRGAPVTLPIERVEPWRPALESSPPLPDTMIETPLAERMLNARALLGRDPVAGRALLLQILLDAEADAARTRAGEEDDEASPEQIASAVRLLLGRQG